MPQLLDAMIDEAINKGNAAMSKLLLQVNGLLTDKVEVESKSAGKGSRREKAVNSCRESVCDEINFEFAGN